MSALKTVLLIAIAAVVCLEQHASARGLVDKAADVGTANVLKPVDKDVAFVTNEKVTASFSLEPTCSYCGGYSPTQCSRLCGQLGYPYYWCDPCSCVCHFG
ncbi:unnamed protein product [Allacma fusca]|uniref:Uncharacterized protein n=1 Tax=Allacma fusca TaxID=39272 RepID=A0A8J2LMN4_9HEXA|nr:unnamed protein product [Allacma fusca]